MKRSALLGLTIVVVFAFWHLPTRGPTLTGPVQAAAAEQAADLKKHLTGLPEIFTLNEGGDDYLTVKFNHAAHSSEKYGAGITCQTCHHTQKADEKPEKCSKCHAPGGEAKETKKKWKAAHNKDDVFPKATGQKAVSCLGCHTAENALLAAGKRTGKEAPTKCTLCHEEKAG
jgi:hypothetical protein